MTAKDARILFPANATHIVVVVLIVVVHVAIVEIHVPGVVAIVLSRRPIVVGLSISTPALINSPKV